MLRLGVERDESVAVKLAPIQHGDDVPHRFAGEHGVLRQVTVLVLPVLELRRVQLALQDGVVGRRIVDLLRKLVAPRLFVDTVELVTHMAPAT